MSDPLAAVARWGVEAAAGWRSGERSQLTGPAEQVYPWASVTKIVTALAVWVAVEEATVGWDDAVGPPGATLRHLMAHASGLEFDSDRIVCPPGERRIYSNTGIELAAGHVARAAGMAFDSYAREAVLDPLAMTSTSFAGSPAHGAAGPLRDLMALAGELLHPTLVAPGTLAHVTSVAFPGLDGLLPGFGHQTHNDWGLGVEIRDHKRPHWTGARNSARTFGHFGRSGSFLWVDPEARLALASVAGRDFGSWAARAWPALSDSVLEALA